MRVLGALLFAVGAVATAYSVRGAFGGRRPRDLAFAIAAPLAFIIGLVGLLLVFVPGFFDG